MRSANACFLACRIQLRATQWQREAGLLPPEPQVLLYQTSQAEPLPEPALMATVQGDPEAFMTLNLSRNLDQGMNPAYLLRDGFQTQSCMKADFVWDQDEVRYATLQTMRGTDGNRLCQFGLCWLPALISPMPQSTMMVAQVAQSAMLHCFLPSQHSNSMSHVILWCQISSFSLMTAVSSCASCCQPSDCAVTQTMGACIAAFAQGSLVSSPA